MKITKLFIPVLLLLSLFTGLVPKPVEALTLNPGVYYHAGYTNYTVGHAMEFSTLTIESNHVGFNTTMFYTTATPSTTPVNITLNYLHPSPGANNTPGTLLLNFTAEAPLGTTPVTFTIGGFPIGYNYTINKNETLDATSSADIHGNISFTNTTGTWDGNAHNYTIYLSTITATDTRNPVQIKANWTTTTSVNLEWKKGVNTTNTLIIRKTGSYPTTTTDGTIIYNGTAISYNNTGLNPSIRYFYKAYGWSSSLSYSSGVNIAFVETDNTTTTTSSSATFNGYMTTDKTMNTRFLYGSTNDFTSTLVTSISQKQNYTPAYTDWINYITSTSWAGQSFKTGNERYYIYNITTKLQRTGSPGLLVVSLYEANTSGPTYGLPTGSAVSVGSMDPSTIPASLTWTNVTMSSYQLKSNTKYCFIEKTDGVFGLNYLRSASMGPPPTYADGCTVESLDGGATYHNDTSDYPTSDTSFKIWGATYTTYTTAPSTSSTNLLTSGLFSITQGSLNKGQLYYYKALADDSKNNMTRGNIRTTLTNPDIPIFMTIVPYYSNFSVKITWIKGTGANNTVAVMSHISYPGSTTDGSIVYNGTGSSCWVTNISFNSSYYFSLFSYTVWDGLYRFSSGVHVPWGGITVMCYNESKPWQSIRFDMTVTDNLGLHPVQFLNILSYTFNITQIPYGSNTLFYISNSSYHSRLYPISIVQNIFYNLSFYLPPLWIPPGPAPPGGNETGPYRIQVINEYQVPVQGVLVKIYRYFNTTANYTYIGGFVSDGNGQGSIDLYPFQLYMIKITCDGYIDATEFWTPTVEEQSLSISKTFKIYHSVVPEPGIFDNLVVTIEPTQTVFYDGFTAYFNITSSDAQLMWMTATMSRYNSTTTSWLGLFSQNTTTTTGGSISYAVPNITGVYQWSCSFGKTGFGNYTTMMAYSIVEPANNSDPLDEIIRHIGGRSPIYIPTLSGETVASWSALIASFVAIFVLFGFSPKFSGLAVMSTGAIMGVCKSPLGIIPNSVLNWVACGFIIILGILMVMADKKEGGD